MINQVTVTSIDEEIKPLTQHSNRERCIFMEWTFDGLKKTFSADKQKNQLFIPILSQTKQEFILFLKDYPEYPSPCDVVIVNGDASIRHQLCPPEMVSDQYIEYEKKIGKKNATRSLTFIQLGDYNLLDKNIASIWVGFGWDWYEVRELNLKTGQFGKCLGTSRL